MPVRRSSTSKFSSWPMPSCLRSRSIHPACSLWGSRLTATRITVADLVLLAVQGLLAAGLGGKIFAKLVSGAVDAVIRGQRGGEDDALHESGAAARLERGVKDVGGVGPDVRREEIGDGRPGDLLEVSLEFRFFRPPGEVGIGLRETAFGE